MPAKGLLLLNLGSPDSPNPTDVKRFLDEFLMDPYVMDIPKPIRHILVRWLITPKRSQVVAEAYKKIWRPEGAPLAHFTRRFAESVQRRLAPQWDVRWGMRYGQYGCEQAVRDWHVDQVYVVPLYPQYAESSTRSAIDQAVTCLRKTPATEILLLPDFFSRVEFIEAQARQIAQQLKGFNPDRLLLSFHGLPEHHLKKLHPRHCFSTVNCCDSIGDNNRNCYRAQVIATAKALQDRLPLAKSQVQVAFQSRLGRRPWIRPYSDQVVEQLAAQGVKRLLVSCPSFVADCLETLEEVEIRMKDQFLAAGGEALRMVPALNAESHWIENFARMISSNQLRWRALTKGEKF